MSSCGKSNLLRIRNVNFDFNKHLYNSIDKYLRYYKTHFKIQEQRFYEHIYDLVIVLSKTKFSLLTSNLVNLRRIDTYEDLVKVSFNNFGFCYISRMKKTGKKVILKHIKNFYSQHQRKSLLEKAKQISQISSNHLQKFLHEILLENDGLLSLWYVFDYTHTINIDLVENLLHKMILKYTLTNESDFVHLLYTCNSTLDKSKETFPNFINIVRNLSAQLLYGLSHLHEKGIIHQYLNPSNVSLTITGVLKITDLGVANKHRWLQYCSRSFIEIETVLDQYSYKNPSESFKLGRHYHYMHPRARVAHSYNFNLSTSNTLPYHMDYFSCAMILFELVFGFTYGDMELYKNYSFYKQFCKYDLIFFFPDHYIEMFQNLRNFTLIIKDFNLFKLDNLKSFLVNHEEGFIDFIIEGLSIGSSLWSDLFTTSDSRKCLNILNLQKEISFFKNTDFNNLCNNIPKDLVKVLMEFRSKAETMKSDVHIKKGGKVFDINSRYKLKNEESLEIFSSDYRLSSELPDKHFKKSATTENTSSKIMENIKRNTNGELFDKDPFFIDRNRGENIKKLNSDVFFKEKGTVVPTEKTEMIHSDKTMNNRKYTSVFLHHFFDKLSRKKRKKSYDRELHNFMKSKLKDDIKDENSIFEPCSAQPVFSFDEIKNPQNNMISILNRNVSANANPIHDKIRNKTLFNNDENIMKHHQLPSTGVYNYEIMNHRKSSLLHSKKNYRKNFFKKIPYSLRYHFNKCKKCWSYKLVKNRLKSKISSCSHHSSNFIIRNGENRKILEVSKHLQLKDLKGEKRSVKNITSYGSTRKGMTFIHQYEQPRHGSVNEERFKSVSAIQNEVNLKNSHHINNDVETKTTNLKNLTITSSTKSISIEPTSNLRDNDLDEEEQKNKKTWFRTKCHKDCERKGMNLKRCKINQSKDVISSKKRKCLMDSNVTMLLENKSRMNPSFNLVEPDERKSESKSIQTWFNDPILINNSSSLFNNIKRNITSHIMYPVRSVISLQNMESQTDQSCQLCLQISKEQDSFLKDSQIFGSFHQTHSENVKSSGGNCHQNESSKFWVGQKSLTENLSFQCYDAGIEMEITNVNEIADEIEHLDPTNGELFFHEEPVQLFRDKHINLQEPACSNECQLVLLSSNVVEEQTDSPERTISFLKDISIRNKFAVSFSSKAKSNIFRKSVSFKSPVISDIFNYSLTKLFPEENTKKQPKGILKDTVEKSSTNYETNKTNENVSYYYRPKVNNYNLDIIDDWLDSDDTLLKNDLNQEFDAKTMNDSHLVRPMTTSSNLRLQWPDDDTSLTEKNS